MKRVQRLLDCCSFPRYGLMVSFILIMSVVPVTAQLGRQTSIVDPVRFKHLFQGISTPMISAITEDSLGRIWLGTQTNLVRFDGYIFTEYAQEPFNKHSLSGWVLAICEGKDGDF